MPVSAYRSSIGKKIVVAVTGVMLLGFVIAHLAGNLLIFAGPDALNAYALKLEHLEGLLWIARGVLLLAVVVHIVTTIMLVRENREARPVQYAAATPIQTTLAARTMALSGLMILAFVVYHLLHFTFGVTHPEISHLSDALGRHDVYSMVVLSFQQLPIAAAYAIAVLLLAMHLSHGVSSAVQTLGGISPHTLETVRRIGFGLALVLGLGYLSIPLCVQLGWITTRVSP